MLAFKGSRSLTTAVDALRDIAERLPDRRIATHAELALGNALARSYKVLELDADGPTIVLRAPDPDAARAHLDAALTAAPDVAADTLGHIDYTQHVVDQASFLAAAGAPDEAADTLGEAEAVLARRGVLEDVVAAVGEERARYVGRKARASG